MNSTDNRTATSTSRVADERESAILGQTALTAIVVVIYASLVVATGLALVGQLLAPTIFLLFAGLPAWVLMPLAERRFVDTGAIVAGAPARRTLVAAATVVVGMLLALAAMAYTIHTGHGLVGLPDVAVAGPDASGLAASLTRGAVYGAGGAVVVLGVVVAVVTARRRTSRP